MGCDKKPSADENPSRTIDIAEAGIQSNRGVIPTRATPDVARQSEIKSYIRGPKKHRITQGDATIQLRLFKIWADRISIQAGAGSVNWSEAMYGYYFDFGTLYNYVDSIRQYNDTQSVDSLKIDGLRLYHGAKLLPSGFMPDVFFYPTRDTLYIDTIDDDYVTFRSKFFNGNKALMTDEEFFEQLREEIENTPFEEGGSGYNATFPCPQSCP
ncbi:MAG: hypothetical protein RLP11_01700 [Marinoscillum sp.]|uniref:hypothetical protein n=1 Tax=Marinoscillum sp. TaxID=2024838 RepID=UPI0033029428